MNAEPRQIALPDAFQSLWTPSRYKGFWGGRGSAKSWSVATTLLLQAAQKRERVLCCREVQKSLGDSVKQLLDDRIGELGLAGYYSSTKNEITNPLGSKFIFGGLSDETADSIKSKEGVTKVWIEEAQSVSQRSLNILIPTIRAPNSEIWATWNPENEYDPIDRLLRGKNVPPDAIVRQVSWRDNPWFPDVLRAEKDYLEKTDPENYQHVWEGAYRAAPKGAYYAELLARAATEGRIGRVPHDPALEVHVSFDLGVGQKQVLWFTQRIGRELRWIDYLEGDEEAANEGYAWYARKMREKPYTYAPLAFPHDARVREATGKSRAETMEGLGFKVVILPMLGVEDGIDAMKRVIPISWIDADKCAPGLVHLKAYREDVDDKTGRSNGPFKDATGHAADSARYTAVHYEAPRVKKKGAEREYAGSWMG